MGAGSRETTGSTKGFSCFREFDSKGLLDVFLAPMKSRSFWLFEAIAFLALLTLNSNLSTTMPANIDVSQAGAATISPAAQGAYVAILGLHSGET